jgi:hypothetical protein
MLDIVSKTRYLHFPYHIKEKLFRIINADHTNSFHTCSNSEQGCSAASQWPTSLLSCEVSEWLAALTDRLAHCAGNSAKYDPAGLYIIVCRGTFLETLGLLFEPRVFEFVIEIHFLETLAMLRLTNERCALSVVHIA